MHINKHCILCTNEAVCEWDMVAFILVVKNVFVEYIRRKISLLV